MVIVGVQINLFITFAVRLKSGKSADPYFGEVGEWLKPTVC